MPTIEEVIWYALRKAHLISPAPDPRVPKGEVNWKGCDFSKCGRTDKGVSSYGQVIGLRVRSNRPLDLLRKDASTSVVAVDDIGKNNPFSREEPSSSLFNEVDGDALLSTKTASWSDDSQHFHPIDDEIPYVRKLNQILPPDIRVLAWCANPPANFSARFSCEERRYRYFFTQPAFTPTWGKDGVRQNRAGPALSVGQREGWLDIETMKAAVKKFEGLHDFRNFCKLDQCKRITNFERRIFHADIEEVDAGMGYIGIPAFQHYKDSALGPESFSNVHSPVKAIYPKVYTVILHGTAFLWHQIRHMVAILFLIGQGLESPDLIDELLDVQKNPQKPVYKMADDAPLVLWDCVFPSEESNAGDNAVKWIFVGDSAGSETSVGHAGGWKGAGRHGTGGVVDDMWTVWRQRKIDELLAGTLLNLVVGQGTQDPSTDHPPQQNTKAAMSPPSRNQKVFMGGNSPRMDGRYVPVLEKPRLETPEVVNARYAERKGLEPKVEMKSGESQHDTLQSEEPI